MEVVEFLRRAFTKECTFLNLAQFASSVKFTQTPRMIIAVTVLWLEQDAIGEEVANIAEVLCAHGANAIDRIITAVSSRYRPVSPRFDESWIRYARAKGYPRRNANRP